MRTATSKNLLAVLEKAAADVACIQRDEYHYAAGGLIARVSDEAPLATYEAFATSDDVDLAYQIGPPGENSAFLFSRLSC